jgi:hypothetical protein
MNPSQAMYELELSLQSQSIFARLIPLVHESLKIQFLEVIFTRSPPVSQGFACLPHQQLILLERDDAESNFY